MSLQDSTSAESLNLKTPCPCDYAAEAVSGLKQSSHMKTGHYWSPL